MSTISTLADAVAEHINAGTYAQPVAAVRTYQPAFTLEDLGELRVSVVPRTTTVAAAIEAHGGEAEAVRMAYEALGPSEKAALLAFLEGL